MVKIKHIPFEIYGRLYETLGFKKIAKNFIPDDFHIRVLCYHDIPGKNLGLFEKQIIFLEKEYKIIGPEELRDFFLGRGFLPGTNVFITFDDGSADQYQAAEILDKHGIKAAFFICPQDIEKEDFIASRPKSQLKPMSWQEIKDLHKRGHVISSHSMSHPVLAKLQPTGVYKELQKSKEILEEKLNSKVDFFAYPYGTDKEISDEAILIAKKLYDFNFTFIPGKNHFETANCSLIKRTGVNSKYSLYHLRALLSGLKDS